MLQNIRVFYVQIGKLFIGKNRFARHIIGTQLAMCPVFAALFLVGWGYYGEFLKGVFALRCKIRYNNVVHFITVCPLEIIHIYIAYA